MNAPAQKQDANVVAIARLQPSRLPIAGSVATEFGVSAADWRVLVDQIFPSAKTIEAVGMALAYCKRRNLDIFKKPVHIVPMWSTALGRMVETVWPGIAEIRTTAARTGEYAGIDEVAFGPMIERTFTGSSGGRNSEEITKTVRFPEWASVVVYRFVKGQRCAYHTKIFWEETYASIGKSDVPNDMWAKRPRGQFDKCVEAAGLRKAFPEELGSMYAAEEMEGRTIDVAANDQPPKLTPPSPPSPPSPPTIEADAPIIDESAEAATGETPDTAEFFEQLEGALVLTMDVDSLEEAWSEADPEATFDGDDLNLEIAGKIKARHLARIEALKAPAPPSPPEAEDDMFPSDKP